MDGLRVGQFLSHSGSGRLYEVTIVGPAYAYARIIRNGKPYGKLVNVTPGRFIPVRDADGQPIVVARNAAGQAVAPDARRAIGDQLLAAFRDDDR